jgi:outer membrane protein assembly factor BamD (BamD/ComL family)
MRYVLCLTAVLLATSAQAASSTALVGPGVGPADLYTSQALKDYNARRYDAARDELLKALHAKPDVIPAYLTLARSYLKTGQVALACWTYRTYVKNAPATPDRDKANAEAANCERQRTHLKPPPADPGVAFVEQKAAFQEAVEAAKLLGPGSASAILEQLLKDGYVAPDLTDLAAKLRASAESKATATFQKAATHEVVDPVALREVTPLYHLAEDVGATDPSSAAKGHFAEGVAALQEKKWSDAEHALNASMGAGVDKDAKFYSAVAVYRSGEHKRAVAMLEKELPDDPRTVVLKVDADVARDPRDGAEALEKLIFLERFKTTQP